MAYVTDGEAEKIAGYRQQQAATARGQHSTADAKPIYGPFPPSSQPVAPPVAQPDPFQNFVDPYGTQDIIAGPAAPAAPQYGPFLPEPAWTDFGGGQGGYVEPGTGNIWSDGLWYDPDNGSVWNEPFGGWQAPQEYTDYWSGLQQHEAAFPYPDAGEMYSLGSSWSPLAPGYDLDFERPSPILEEPPRYDPRGAAFQASQRSESNPFLDDLRSSLAEAAGLFSERTQRLPGLIEGLGGMFGLGGRAGGLPETEQIAEIYQKDILPNVSGNEFIRSFTPYEPENLPYGLDRLTDALAPINFATAAIAPSVPLLGAMFKGPYAKNLASEMGIDIGARLLGEQAAGDVGESIPLFGEQPAWLRGLEGGLIGGLGAAGAIKGADVGIPALKGFMDEPIEVAPGQFVTRGEFGGGKFGPVEPNDVPDEILTELRARGIEVAPDGSVQLYHGTTADKAAEIRRTGKLTSAGEPDVYVSTDPKVPYGDTVIPVRVRAKDLLPDDEFPSGRMDFRIAAPRKTYDLVPEPPKLAADAGPVAQPGVDVPFPGQRAILDALQEQIRFRESGEAEALIRAGRATQAKGIQEALVQGETLEEIVQGAQAGMRVGSMLGEGAPLNLTDEAVQAATKEIVDAGLASGRVFDTYGALRALQKLQDGEWLQPAEIKKLGSIFGADVESAIRKTNAGRIKVTADLTPEDVTRIDRLAEVEGKKAARAEIEAQAQHKLADELAKRARMDPTNKRLANAAGEARARALKLEADAERFQVERIEKLEAQARAKTQREMARQNREEVRQAELRDKRELRDAATLEYRESGQKALDQVLAMIEKSDMPDEAKASATDFIEQMVKADGAFLDVMKGDAPGFLRTVYAGAVGEVSDSWVSALIEQRAITSGVLQDIGFDQKTASAIARTLSDMEVMRRWGPEPPPHIVQSLDQAKRSFSGPENAITGLATISQEWKNMMFGLFDIGVAGIQGLAAGAQGAAAVMAGLVNRTLNIARMGVDTSPGNLTKRLQYGVDGRIRGVATATGNVDPDAGTLLRHIPGMKTIDRKVVSRAIQAMNDLQFRKAMGFIGDLLHEGQLVMLKLAGEDITDPVVRRQSAEWANVISSAAKLAQRPGRMQAERAFIISPSMIRSQAQVLGGVARILAPGTPRASRILAASTVVSYAASVLAIGKFLNDAIGTEDFVFDPSDPKFGRIRLGDGTVINPFPQTQLARLLARSIRVIAEEGDGEQDPKMLGKAWLNLGLGRLSPAAAIGAAAAGVGFDPDIGWRYGDLNEGKSWWEQVMENVLPVPPLIESTVREGLDPVRTPLQATGLSNYEESDYAARERALKADPRFGGRGWSELEPFEKAIVNAEGGRVYSSDPSIRKQQEKADIIAGDARAYQEKIDQWLLAGKKPDGTTYTAADWREDRAKHDAFIAGRYEELYAGVDWKKDDLNPVDLYYKAIADAVDPKTDEVNWDKVDAWKATLSEEDRAYIERNTNLRDTNLEQQWRRDVKMLSDSGYFDAENKVAVRRADPEIAAAVRRWGYSEMSVKAEDTVLKYTAQQEVDDRSLAQGAITPEQWRENYNTRRDQLRAEKDGIYAGMKDDGVSTEPLDQYFKEIEKAVGPNGIDIDWQQVDEWVAQQPADVQEVINSYASPGLTPVVDQYRSDVKKIVETGYWDLDDAVTQIWAESMGFKWEEGQTAERFWQEVNSEVVDLFKSEGFSTLEAQAMAGVAMGKLQGKYVDVLGKVKSGLRDANPELARLLVQWGYWEPGKKDTGELLAAGTLR